MGRGGHVYTPAATRDYEDRVVQEVQIQLRRAKRTLAIPAPFDGRVIARLRFNFQRPPSLPRRVEDKKTKPDWDNLSKSVIDGLEKAGVFTNDSRITDAVTSKRFVSDGHPEGVEVELLCWLE